MKKLRALLLILLTLLLIIAIPTGFFVREYRREQASRDLIAAIKAEDTDKALAALRAGADANMLARLPLPWEELPDNSSLSFIEQMKQFLNKLLHPSVKNDTDDYTTPLLLHLQVSEDDNPILVKALLDAGADPNFTAFECLFSLPYRTVSKSPPPSQPTTPLCMASRGKHPQSVRLLLQYGGNIHWKDSYGSTALHCAMEYRNAETISLLLDAGAEINAQDNNGATPLYCACENDTHEAVLILLRHHANMNLRDKRGDTPLDVAMRPFTYAASPVSDWLRKAGAKTGKELDAQAANSLKH